MIWALFVVVALAVVGVFAALVTGRWRYDPMAEPTHTVADPGLPPTVHAADVDGVRFDHAARGYRTDQVDDVLDRLRDRLAEQDRTIAAQRQTLTEHGLTDQELSRAVDDAQPIDSDAARQALRDEADPT